MHHHPMITRHALKFDLLSKVQQQRVMKKLASQARNYSKEKLENAPSAEADLYTWHRRVRLSREARALHLVRAFLKGTPYKRVEQANTEHTLNPIECFGNYISADSFAHSMKSEFIKWVEVP